MKRLASIVIAITILALLTACRSVDRAETRPADTSKTGSFFGSPEESAARIDRLLRDEDWKTLADFYDLAASGVDKSELTSGRYFLRTERPQEWHPGLAWKYREPFTPGMTFDHVESTSDPSVVRVVVVRRIDQGGGMPQRVMDDYRLRKSARGYQLLPESPEGLPSRKSARTPAEEEMLRGYEPKTTPDTVVHYRPALAERLDALPPMKVEALPDLLRRLDELNRAVAADPTRADARSIGPAGPTYDASDDQLLASELGQRIGEVLERTHPSDVVKVLDAAGYANKEVGYDLIEIAHADVMGSGRFFLAEAPARRTLMLPKKMTGF